MLVERRFDTGEVVLNYAEGPNNGPPLILMHGVSGTWKYLLPIIDATINRWHIYAFDMRGHGKSGKTPNKYKLLDYARDIGNFIEKELTEPPALFGHSLGGMVSTIIAGSHKDSIRGIVIGDSQLNINSRETFDRFRNNEPLIQAFTTIRDISATDLSPLDKVKKIYGHPLRNTSRNTGYSYDGHDSTAIGCWVDCTTSYELYLELNEGYDCDRLFKEITCPILLVQSNNILGGVMVDKDVEYISSVHNDVTHVYLENAGHIMGLDVGNIGWVNSPLRLFLESIR